MLLDTLVLRFEANIDQYMGGIKAVENSLNAFYRRIQYRTFNAGLMFASGLIKGAMAFDEAMSNTMDTMEGGTEAIRREMERSVLSLGVNSLTAPLELAHIYEEMSRSGMSAASSIAALSAVEKFSILNHVKAADAARDLIGLQRALGRESNDALENAQNLQRIGDVITSVAMRAQVPQADFFRAIHRMAPVIGTMNRGLEDSVAILATFTTNNMTAAQAASATINLISNIQQLAGRSVRTANRMASGRILQVHPMHGLPGPGHHNQIGSFPAEIAFDPSGNMRSMVDIVSRLADSYGHLGVQELRARLANIGFTGANLLHVETLIRSRDAMVSFVETAARADGIMDQLYNRHMRTFSGQMTILMHNTRILAIELGRMLIPYLLMVNTVVLNTFNVWNGFNDATKGTIVGIILFVASLVALYAIGPSIIGFLGAMWNGLLRLANIIVTLIALPFVGMFYTAIFALRGMLIVLRLAAVAVYFLGLQLKNLVSGIWAVLAAIVSALPAIIIFIDGMIMDIFIMGTSALAFYASSLLAYYGLLLLAAMLPLKVVLGIIVGLLVAAALASSYFAAAANWSTISSLLWSAATWVLNAALTVLSFLLQIIGSILVGFAAGLAILLGVVAVIGLVVWGLSEVGSLNTMTGADWENIWTNIANVTADAFWIMIGLFYNFKENIQAFIVWLAQNWRLMVIDMMSVLEAGIKNSLHNIGQFLRETAGMGYNFRTGQFTSTMPGNYTNPMEGRAAFQTQPLHFNYDVPADVREMVLNTVRRLAGGHDSNQEEHTASGNAGDIYREMSLRRFVLDTGVPTAQDRILTTNSPNTDSLLERILNTLRDRGGLGR